MYVDPEKLLCVLKPLFSCLKCQKETLLECDEFRFPLLYVFNDVYVYGVKLYSFDGEGKIKEKQNRRKLLMRWKKSSFKKSNNTQIKFLELESRHFEEPRKREIILDSLYFDNSEDFLAFTVCRNPVERLLSVYKYLSDMFQIRRIFKSHSNK